MKKLLVVAAAAFLFSCNQDELDRANQQRDSLMNILNEREGDLSEKESSINDFITSFNEVERNLDSVARRQSIILVEADKTNKGDIRGSQKDRINQNIEAINDLMEQNRKTIDELKRKLKGSSKINAKLKETITTLQNQLAQKDQELAALNEKLTALNAQVVQLQTSLDTLTAESNRRGQTIEQTTAALHTAYYVVGRARELRDAKLIDRKGGLLGLGKTSQLSGNIDNSKFTKIDYTQTTTIAINSDDVKIITTHPTDSYKMETDEKKKNIVRNLVITNPEKFWSASRYLVIEGNPVKK